MSDIFHGGKMKYLLLLSALFISAQTLARTDLAQEGAYVPDSNKKIINSISVNKDLIFDHVNSKGFEVYGPYGLFKYLDSLHVGYVPLNNRMMDQTDYETPEQLEQEIEDLHAQYPQQTQVFDIGRSVEGRKLLVLKISANAAVDEVKPEFKYISSMHGDEITGRQLMMMLAKDLLSNYKKDPEITSLVDNTEIFIMPSMNPDGTHYQQRANAHGVDLNRAFPDFTTDDDKDSPDGREPEVQAIMKFQKAHNIAMSANFHGGSEVVNYMWDAQPAKHPFDSLLVDLAHDYANRVDYIKASDEFQDGITNGYDWYQVLGGMQDWSYHWYNDLQFTIELSNQKWPSFSKMGYYYEKNKDAMIQFIRDVHTGAGFKLDQPNLSGDATLYRIENDTKTNLGTYHFTHSEFYKVLPVGEYSFDIKADSAEETKTVIVSVQKEQNTYSVNYKVVN
jgi:hypothetical protein